jgi:hypothetical protein
MLIFICCVCSVSGLMRCAAVYASCGLISPSCVDAYGEASPGRRRIACSDGSFAIGKAAVLTVVTFALRSTGSPTPLAVPGSWIENFDFAASACGGSAN